MSKDHKISVITFITVGVRIRLGDPPTIFMPISRNKLFTLLFLLSLFLLVLTSCCVCSSSDLSSNSSHLFLIHSADPHSRPVVSLFSYVSSVRSSVPTLQNNSKQNNFQVKTIVITTGVSVGLAEWIIDDTCLVFFIVIRRGLKKTYL